MVPLGLCVCRYFAYSERLSRRGQSLLRTHIECLPQNLQQLARHRHLAVGIGNNYLFTSLAAVLVGGTSLVGARGNYGRTVLGALILTLITTLLVGHGAGTAVQEIVFGVLIMMLSRSVRTRHTPARPHLKVEAKASAHAPERRGRHVLGRWRVRARTAVTAPQRCYRPQLFASGGNGRLAPQVGAG